MKPKERGVCPHCKPTILFNSFMGYHCTSPKHPDYARNCREDYSSYSELCTLLDAKDCNYKEK